MNLGELFVTLGIKGKGLGTLKDIAKTIANLPADAALAILGMAGISLELGKLAEEAMHTAVSFQAFTNQTGLSWQQLQKWQIVAEQANVSSEAVAQSIGTLERNLAEIRIGRGNLLPFTALGVNPVGQNAFGVLQQLHLAIKRVSPAMATNMISAMGLSPEMMNVLRLSDRQFTEFANHVHGLNERQEQDFLKARLSIVQLGQEFRYSAFTMLSHFEEAVEKGEKFKRVLVGIGIAAAALAIYFAPITAAVLAFVLVLDDLAVYFTGGKSLTGVGINGLKKFFNDIKTELGNMSWLADLERFATILTDIANANANLISSFAKFVIPKEIKDILGFFQMTPMPLPAAATGGSTNNTATINVNVSGAGSLDAPGWTNIAHMIKKSVEDAHLQLNN